MASKKEYVSENPRLMKEWNWEKNVDFDPNQLTLGSHAKICWKCEKGHEWEAIISNRSKGRGCPYCSNRKVLKGYNDLQTINPILAKEWNCEKNNGLTPIDIMPNSNKKAWWKCGKGHEWQATIGSRNAGNGCPYCSNKKVLKGYNDLQTVNPNLAKEWNYEKNGDLKPCMVTFGSEKVVWWKCEKGHEWQADMAHRRRGNGCPICSLGRRTSFPEYAIEYYLNKIGIKAIHLYKGEGYELDIFIPSKKVAIEYDGYVWHKNQEKRDLGKNLKCKNDGITLYRIREGLAPLNDTSLDYVVPKYQKGLSVIIEKVLSEITEMDIDVDLERDEIAIQNLRGLKEQENSVLSLNPEIGKEWNYEMNGNLKPEYFMPNSGKKVWWMCSKGHEWQATIINRNKGTGCPYCSNNKVFEGYNDLSKINPFLSQEWNYEKNNGLTPMDVMPNSNKKAWWKCAQGHEWQAVVSHRNNGNKCPYCSNNKVLKDYNDLQTINPTLAKEWNYEKNNGLTPMDVMPNSGKKVWWKCGKGHEWEASIASRSSGCGCPYCAGKKVLNEYNDLKTVNPNLAKEWNYEKNEDSKPEQYTANSNKKVWWKCPNGHEWQARINGRNSGNGCPYCAGQKAIVGYNDLQTVNPSLAKEWNYDKNDGLTPMDITSNSGKKVWWECEKGHEWEAIVCNRNRGNGCPQCYKEKRKATI